MGAFLDGLVERLLAADARYGEALVVAAVSTLLVCALHFAGSRAAGRLGWRRGPTSFVPRAIALAALALAVLLGVTAAVGLLTDGELVAAPLFAHVALGGAFVVVLALLVLTRGAGHRARGPHARFGPTARWGFWLFAVAGTVAGATMMLATLPWFGTVWMERLFLLHRQAGLVTVCAALVHGYGLLLGRFGATPSPRTVKTA